MSDPRKEYLCRNGVHIVSDIDSHYPCMQCFQTNYFNILNEGFYFDQIIDESCNGDYKVNHFRKVLTLQDCVWAFEQSQKLKRGVNHLRMV